MEPRLGKEGYTKVSPFGDDFNFQDLFDGRKQGFFLLSNEYPRYGWTLFSQKGIWRALLIVKSNWIDILKRSLSYIDMQ